LVIFSGSCLASMTTPLPEVVHEALEGLGQADERDRSDHDRDEGDPRLGRRRDAHLSAGLLHPEGGLVGVLVRDLESFQENSTTRSSGTRPPPLRLRPLDR
jgi:hypothetical protein